MAVARLKGNSTNGQLISSLLLTALFCFAGYMHFRRPGFFLKAMPPYVPFHMPAVLISGFFEILGGLGLILPRSRRAAGIGLIALLAAVFPANIYMAMDSTQFNSIPPAVLWLRLPLQFVFMAWVNWSTKSQAQTQAQTEDR